MIVNTALAMPSVMLGFLLMGIAMIGAMLLVMHRKHRYHPNLIGALLGAMLCFLLIEALPALI